MLGTIIHTRIGVGSWLLGGESYALYQVALYGEGRSYVAQAYLGS